MTVIKGVPRKIATDRGTENVLIAGSQIFFERNHLNDLVEYFSIEFGKSVVN